MSAERKALARCDDDDRHDAHHSGRLDGKVVEWMEKVTQQQYVAGQSAESKKTRSVRELTVLL